MGKKTEVGGHIAEERTAAGWRIAAGKHTGVGQRTAAEKRTVVRGIVADLAEYTTEAAHCSQMLKNSIFPIR